MRKNQITILIIVIIIAFIMLIFPPYAYNYTPGYYFLFSYEVNSINIKMLLFQYLALCFVGAIAFLIEYQASKK